jgi:hypothetical protein
MKKKLLKSGIFILIFFIGLICGILLRQNQKAGSIEKNPMVKSYINSNDTIKTGWSEDFELVDIFSTSDSTLQKAYFYRSTSKKANPLIVSLHTWSNDYSQIDELSEICKQKDINYIHPDFRGPNVTRDACCSELALNDIDDAITYALRNSIVDTNKIFVIGVSGGGYATLCTFMKSKHKISKFSAWASISDLIAWYNESKIRNNGYAENILACTASDNELNETNAKQKSPMYWDTPLAKLSSSRLFIYAGIYDGIQGSVPITHSINFYNKLLADLKVTDSSRYISCKEKLELLEYRKPLGDYGNIAGRKICLRKESGKIKLTIFEGNHEMLPEFALNELLNE